MVLSIYNHTHTYIDGLAQDCSHRYIVHPNQCLNGLHFAIFVMLWYWYPSLILWQSYLPCASEVNLANIGIKSYGLKTMVLSKQTKHEYIYWEAPFITIVSVLSLPFKPSIWGQICVILVADVGDHLCFSWFPLPVSMRWSFITDQHKNSCMGLSYTVFWFILIVYSWDKWCNHSYALGHFIGTISILWFCSASEVTLGWRIRFTLIGT